MQVVVLAGGIGSRLQPWTFDIPKPILPMLDKTLIEHVIQNVPPKLMTELIVAGGYKINQIKEYFEQMKPDFEVTIVPEDEPLGTGGALGNCRGHIHGRFLCFNGDVISSLNISKMLDLHEKSNAMGTLGLWKVEDPTRFGIVGIDEQYQIQRFKEKPTPDEVFSHLINAGSYIFEKEIFDYMPEGKHSLERDVFPRLAIERKLFGFPFEGFFIDAGTSESWIEAVKNCLRIESFQNGTMENGSWYEEQIVQAHASMICRGVQSQGNIEASSVLENAIIEKDVTIRDCLIGKGAHIKQGANLTNVIVDHGAIVPKNHTQNGGRILNAHRTQ